MMHEAEPTDTNATRLIGAEMARLRKEFGLSISQVSARLHIRPRYLEAMEEGKFELLPGLVYARGYVHTYAEFLGMDAAMTVARCFTGDPQVSLPRVATALAPTPYKTPLPWRGLIIAAVIGAAVLLTQGWGGSGDRAHEPEIEAVPDSMRLAARPLVMPTAENYECLMQGGLAACDQAGATTQLMRALEEEIGLRLTGGAPVIPQDWVVSEPAATDAEATHD